ncbi:MAG: hypothetical protein HYS81_02990 [Candidatus Aenigmatarchaeota archaeon]|nr:MAG: hypothetical protein HYS81_02990 [Candidatus Aenigmarchaeota archaeon]
MGSNYPRIAIALLLLFAFVGIYVLAAPLVLDEQRRCTEAFGSACSDTDFNDAKNIPTGCRGDRSLTESQDAHVQDAYINISRTGSTRVQAGTILNATCDFRLVTGGAVGGDFVNIYYYNGTDFATIASRRGSDFGLDADIARNFSADFTSNYTDGEHFIRCTVNQIATTNFCASTTDGSYSDNDDVNFTVFVPINNTRFGANVTNGTSLTRFVSAAPEIFSDWSKRPGTLAVLEHNGTGTRINYTATTYANNFWANRTLNVTNGTEFSNLGRIVFRIFVQNTTNGVLVENSTDTFAYTLFGRSNLTTISTPTYAYVNGPQNTACRAIDNDNSTAIPDLTFFFWDNRTGVHTAQGTAQTNSTGWASRSINMPTTPGVVSIRCNVTDDADVFYNATASNELSQDVTLVNLTLNASTVTGNVNFGSVETFRFDVSGNATTISATANVTFNNITDAGPREKVTTTENMVLVSSPNATYHKYELNYTPPRSGNYTVLFSATAGASDQNSTANATQTFNVTFGSVAVEFENPFRVLTNQTLNITLRVRSFNGDVWNVSIDTNITNQTRMNIIGNGSFINAKFNVSTAVSRTQNYTVIVNYTGLTKIVLNATPTNGTANNSIMGAFEIVQPKIEFSSNPINVSDFITINATVAGNASQVTALYLNISKAFDSGINASALGVSITRAENATALGLRGSNVSSSANGGSVSCSQAATEGSCNGLIDGSTTTNQFPDGTEINITLNSSAVVDKITIRGFTSGRVANFYYLDGATFRNISAISLTGDVATHNVTAFDPFRTSTIKVNFTGPSGTIPVAEIAAFSPPASRTGTEYVYSLAFQNANVSGFYNTTVYATVGGVNVTNTTNFTVRFGTPTFAFVLDPSASVDEGDTIIYNVTVTAVSGDVRDVNLTLNIPNLTVVNRSSTQDALYSNISVIFSGGTNTTSWNLTANKSGSTVTYVTANSTTGSGTLTNQSVTVTVTGPDTTLPIIQDFNFNATSNITSNRTNVRSSLIIWANITDDRSLPSGTSATAGGIVEIEYPNGTLTNRTMQCHACPSPTNTGGVYNLTANLTTAAANRIELDITGNYSVRVFAIDVSGNQNATSTKNFTVGTNYTVRLVTNLPTYNRGDNVTFRAFDTNGVRVSNFNMTVNVTRYNSTLETVLGITNASVSEFAYVFANNDTVGNWTVVARADRLSNEGNVTFTFDLSNELNVSIIDPAENTQYNTQAKVVPIEAYVQDKNSNNRTDATTNVTANCFGSDGSTRRDFSIAYAAARLSYRAADVDNAPCFASSTAGATFSVTLTANDTYNNSKTATLSLKTAAAASSSPDSTGGGGSGGTTSGGGGGGGGGGVEEKIIKIGEEVHEFDFAVSEASVTLKQGEETPLTANIANKGNVPLKVSISIDKECCQISAIDYAEVGAGEAVPFRIDVRVPLNTDMGAYLVTLTATDAETDKKNAQSFKIIVEKSDLVLKIEQLNQAVGELNDEVRRYRTLGLDPSALEQKLAGAQDSLNSALQAVQNDDEASLEASVRLASEQVGDVGISIIGLRIQAFLEENKEAIAGGAVFVLLMWYVVSQIALPYRQLNVTLKELKKQESSFVEARVQAEHQYFKRMIDEATFRQIMFREQDKVVSSRAKIKRAEEELHSLVRQKLSPTVFVMFYVGVARSLPSNVRTFTTNMQARLSGKQVKPQSKPVAKPAFLPRPIVAPKPIVPAKLAIPVRTGWLSTLLKSKPSAPAVSKPATPLVAVPKPIAPAKPVAPAKPGWLSAMFKAKPAPMAPKPTVLIKAPVSSKPGLLAGLLKPRPVTPKPIPSAPKPAAPARQTEPFRLFKPRPLVAKPLTQPKPLFDMSRVIAAMHVRAAKPAPRPAIPVIKPVTKPLIVPTRFVFKLPALELFAKRPSKPQVFVPKPAVKPLLKPLLGKPLFTFAGKAPAPVKPPVVTLKPTYALPKPAATPLVKLSRTSVLQKLGPFGRWLDDARRRAEMRALEGRTKRTLQKLDKMKKPEPEEDSGAL